MRLKIVMLLTLIFAAGLTAWSEDQTKFLWREPAPVLVLTGNAHIDFVGLSDPAMQTTQNPTPGMALPGRKSPWLAAGLSAVLPGAGEFYSERYLKSAIFIAVEVAAWAVAYVYDKKGDRQTDFFQNYANSYWSVVKYAEFTYNTLKPPDKDYNLFNSNYNNPSVPPWKQVNWGELNRLERDIGGYYSHTLPPYGDQQYFELIGKYPQFNMGWEGTVEPFTYGDPLSPHLLYYSGERGKANRYYENASSAIAVAIVNHIVSAIDGAWSAASFNKDLQAHVGLQGVSDGFQYVQVPVVKLSYSF